MSEREAVRAWALVDDENWISLSHLVREDRYDEYQADLDELTTKLAQKGATHSMRLIPVEIRPLPRDKEPER